MIKYRKFLTEKKAQDCIDRLDVLYGYPKPATKTFTIAKPQVHPETGKALVIIKDIFDHKLKRYSNLALRLTDTERAESVELIDPDLVKLGYEMQEVDFEQKPNDGQGEDE